jgi:mediator of RNA polymerase II transcription subunit 7
MADPQQPPPEDEDLVLSFFPDPPPFYKHFTVENQTRLKDIEKEAVTDNDGTDKSSSELGTKLSAEQILALPTELRYLIPPEPPADDDDFHVFGEVAKAKGTDVFEKVMEYISNQLEMGQLLPGWTYEQLYPSTTTADDSSQPTTTSASLDRQNYLFRFLRSILLSYISLLGIVAVNPTSEQRSEKLKDILTMVANMHALINEYRPHQARQTLIEKMEEQVRRKREEVEGVRKMGEKVREVLEGFGREAGGLEQDTTTEKKDEVMTLREDDLRKDAQSQMWEAMDEVLGS